jgi:hypothetical protein
MALSLQLPSANGISSYTLRGTMPVKPGKNIKFNRIAYSAAHVVADPLAAVDPWLTSAVDWDATIAYRRHLWSLGLGVAEAMDTAQRGMGLDWPTSLELIGRSLDAAKDMPGCARSLGLRHRSSGAGERQDRSIRSSPATRSRWRPSRSWAAS